MEPIIFGEPGQKIRLRDIVGIDCVIRYKDGTEDDTLLGLVFMPSAKEVSRDDILKAIEDSLPEGARLLIR